MYIVVHSKDPYLLARLSTELQMEGFSWGSIGTCLQHIANPFYNGRFNWMEVYEPGEFTFISHEGVGYPTRIWLTELNYTWTLETILTEYYKQKTAA